MPNKRYVLVLDYDWLWYLPRIPKSSSIGCGILISTRLFRIFIVRLRVLKNAIDVPIVVDYVFVLIDLERHPQLHESPVDSAHFKLAKETHRFILVTSQVLHLP